MDSIFNDPADEPIELNENGHRTKCTCVDCVGDFSGGDNE